MREEIFVYIIDECSQCKEATCCSCGKETLQYFLNEFDECEDCDGKTRIMLSLNRLQ